MKMYSISLALLFAMPSVSNAQLSREERLKVDAVAQEIFAKEGAPGLALGVAKNGRLIYFRGQGYANLKTKAPVTRTTKFMIGSVTKQFTATAALQLARQGKINLNAPIKTYLPEVPAAWDGVLVTDLIHHTSGLFNMTDTPAITMTRKPMSFAEVVEKLTATKFGFTPGTSWSYTNTGYYLLDEIVERVSKQSLADYLKKNIFEPAGMVDSGPFDFTKIQDREALGYPPSKPDANPAIRVEPSIVRGAGYLLSTIDDMARWDAALHGTMILTERDKEYAFRPVQFRGEKGGSFAYGAGWTISELGGTKIVSHGGAIPGFNAYILRWLGPKVSVFVLRNAMAGQSLEDIGRKMAKVASPEVRQLLGPASGIRDRDPKLTEYLRSQVVNLLAGNRDDATWSEGLKKSLTPQMVKGAAASLKANGALKEMILIRRQKEKSVVVSEYLMIFENTELRLIGSTDAEGKLSGILFQPI